MDVSTCVYARSHVYHVRAQETWLSDGISLPGLRARWALSPAARFRAAVPEHVDQSVSRKNYKTKKLKEQI